MLMFGGSGIILNHRRAVADYQVSRSLLPDDYLYRNWNRGLLRGTCLYVTPDSARHVLIYGGSGIWLADSTGSIVTDFNVGLPTGADYRNIKAVASLPDGSLWAAGQFGLYRYDETSNCWRTCPLPLGEDEKLSVPAGVEVYEIDGPFFFGIANKFDECMKIIGDKPLIRIIRMRKVPFMDTTGLHNLESLYRLSDKEKIRIILSGVNDSVRQTLVKSGFAQTIGEENICPHIHAALARAREVLEKVNKQE